ncbi:MAG: DnaJ domain-containing protein [Myxococcales bacterium]|nr:DnaJ domain-containing protein [Polyangiaceae bacterium]MDW8249782.1 DnaJ domain-containing protein [Myxococcales bacterium]
MNLPGKLRLSTLGDLLGTLHRAGISGTLALREIRGATAGRCHHVHLRRGLIVSVEAAGSSPEPPDRAQVKQHLEELFRLEDAELSFHVARGGCELEVPLTPREFLHGRPRSRDRGQRGAREGSLRRGALTVLGLPPTATPREIQRAFRAQAWVLHPDRHPGVSAERRAELNRAFSRLTQAYRILAEEGSLSG